ncbi:MarR family transcriptional regulator [Bremerella cremea]|uniref:MarR family winged helix-turn-helix transcriptional regulator n=1 Tax=Bremerella cremea TaxID=1031537 RepID=UPI0031E7B83C
MLRYDFEDSLGYWVFSVAHLMTRAMNDELGKLGITYRQWEVLCWLSYMGEITQSELADQMRIEAPTLVGVIDRMERDGWIVRETDPTDRRKKIIRATEKVEPMWEQMVACAASVRSKALRGLESEEVQKVKATLTTIRGNLLSELPGHNIPAEPIGQKRASQAATNS